MSCRRGAVARADAPTNLDQHALSLAQAPFDRQVAAVDALHARAISPCVGDIETYGAHAAQGLLRDAGLAVATLTNRAFGFATPNLIVEARGRLDATLKMAGTIGAETITLTTGGRGTLCWALAAEKFVKAIAPCAARARNAGIALALEPTSHLYADVSIAHRLTDVVTLARSAGIAVGIDLFACWTDADIAASISAGAGLIALVQVSDQFAGDRALPCRAVPGDGMIPLDRLVPLIEQTGFGGYYDLELIGPRISAEGHHVAIGRAAEYIGAMIGPA